MGFLRFLESIRNPFFDGFFSVITEIGGETTLLILGFLFFWCIDKKQGYFTLLCGLFGLCFCLCFRFCFCFRLLGLLALAAAELKLPEGVFPYIQELDDNYINQHFSHMQDESFRAGFELCRRISVHHDSYNNSFLESDLHAIYGTTNYIAILSMDPLEVERKAEEYEAEKAREKAAAKTGKADLEALDKAAAKAVEAFRKLGANYVQIAQAVTKAMAEAVEAES